MARIFAGLALCAAVTLALAYGVGQPPRRSQGPREIDKGAAAAGDVAPTPVLEAAVAPRSQVPLIVLDPGHGGSNTGATSILPSVLEKQVTLAIAELALAKARQRGLNATLTRADDRMLTLRERIEFAEQRNAGLFVSIHANASPSRQQQGFETFVLSARAIDIDTPALRHDLSRDRPGIDPATAQILDDVERGVSQWRSVDVAERVQRALAKARPDSPNRGIRQDSQHVLLGATMPAVLVEVGFIDHPREGRELLSHDTQDRIAGALVDAIAGWAEAQAGAPALPSAPR